MFTCVLGRYVASTVLLAPKPFGGQLHEDKECPFSGITSSGRVWRKCREAMFGVWRRGSDGLVIERSRVRVPAGTAGGFSRFNFLC